MNENDFSVVITTKSRHDFLKRCIESIQKNSILPRTVIIVNDCGDYFTRTLFEFEINFELKIINNDESRGANYCRNLGVSLVDTQVVFFMDDDDFFEPDSFESRISVFNSNSNIDLVYTGFKLVESRDLNLVLREVLPSVANSHNFLRDLMRDGNIIGSTSRVAMKIKLFQEVGGFDELLKSFQDFDLWIRVAQSGIIASDSKAGIRYTVHSNSNSQVSSQFSKYIESSNYIINKYSKIKLFKPYLKSLSSVLFLRVALSSIECTVVSKKYSFLSFIYRPNFKALVVFLFPGFILKKIRSFV